MFSVSIEDLMLQVRAERDRMRAVLEGAQDPDSYDLEVILDLDDAGDPKGEVLDRYRTFVARSQALIDRYDASAA